MISLGTNIDLYILFVFNFERLHFLYEGFYNLSKFCLQFFSFLNYGFFRLFDVNITF